MNRLKSLRMTLASIRRIVRIAMSRDSSAKLSARPRAVEITGTTMITMTRMEMVKGIAVNMTDIRVAKTILIVTMVCFSNILTRLAHT
jgi:hypothetical protein